MHECERAFEILVAKIGIIGAELIGEEHALVHHRAARDRNRIVVGEAPFALVVDLVRDHLAQDVEAALEFGLVADGGAAADEDLHMHGFGRLHRLAERRIVGRHVAPAEQLHAFFGDRLGIDIDDDLTPLRLARQEQVADRVFAGLGQFEAELLRLLREELVRDLHEDTRAVAGTRVRADRAAMLEVE